MFGKKKDKFVKEAEKLLQTAFYGMRDTLTTDDYKRALNYTNVDNNSSLDLVAIFQNAITEYLTGIMVKASDDWVFRNCLMVVSRQFQQFITNSDNHETINEFLKKIWSDYGYDNANANSDTIN